MQNTIKLFSIVSISIIICIGILIQLLPAPECMPLLSVVSIYSVTLARILNIYTDQLDELLTKPALKYAMSQCNVISNNDNNQLTLKQLPEISANEFYSLLMKDPNEIRLKYLTGTNAKPIVIRGINKLDGFAVMNNEWNFKSFAKRFGKIRLPVFKNFSDDTSVERMLFEEFAGNISKKHSTYYARAFHHFFRANKTLSHEMDIHMIDRIFGNNLSSINPLKQSFGLESSTEHFRMFIGPKNSYSRMHSDVFTSMFVNIEGRKKWIFYGPENTPWISPIPQPLNLAYNTPFDIHKPDFKKYPQLKYLNGYETILKSGDAMLFPSFWWHSVQNLDDITIGLDIPHFRALNRMLKSGWILSAGSILNVKSAVKLMTADDSISDLYFDVYSKKK